jgi:nucleolar complex protein 2
MAQSKATKKFEKNKLHDVLKARKNVAKIKQKKQMDVKKKERKARDNARADDVDDGSNKPSSRAEKEDKLGEMSMDQFFEGGFQVPEMAKQSSTKPKTGKRKRTPIENGDATGSDAEMAEATAGAEDSATDSDSGDDAEAHMEQLADLQEKDPEFYKYLKNNDAELLDFAEDADLAEIDALSASEDESTPRKKKKKKAVVQAESDDDDEATTGNEVTKKIIKKWKASMEANSSLRAMREVVLAFRTAAHLNDDEGKNYKYTISDPDGKTPPGKVSPTSAHIGQRTTRFLCLLCSSCQRSCNTTCLSRRPPAEKCKHAASFGPDPY